MIVSPEGMNDLLPDMAFFWNSFRSKALETFGRYGYLPIDTPIVEQTALFVRSIGMGTDVVSKEMFAAISGENLRRWVEEGKSPKAKSLLSLRPEGTAGIVRAVVQHDLVPRGAAPAKLVYAGPMFRAERPQKDRYRQFNQLGIECLGSDSPTIDAEAISMLMDFFGQIGLPYDSFKLLINSIGCESCRSTYREALRSFLLENSASLCETCNTRIELNPLRTLDCKNADCQNVMHVAPKITNYLCNECKCHFDEVKELLCVSSIPYIEEPSLVRGLDYYTRTVFEVQVAEGMGAQNAIGGGGRYDRLAEQIEGRRTPGFGFALGFERVVSALSSIGIEPHVTRSLDVFVACACAEAYKVAFSLAQACRAKGLSADFDHQGRSLKSQLKLANKFNALQVIFLGPDELDGNYVTVRDMENHEERPISMESVVVELVAALTKKSESGPA